jgi:hypothetical protein
MKSTPRNKSPLILSSHDEELVRAIYQYRYMTAEDMAYHRISPKTVPYVRRRLMRLSGGTTHHTNTYLYCFQLPKVDLGRPQKIFTLGVKGRDFLVREVGLPVDWYFRPYKLKHLGFSHLMHALLQTRLVVAATYWSRKQSQYTLTHALLSHQLARMFKLTVVPDAWLLCEDSQGTKYQILLEIDRGMEY